MPPDKTAAAPRAGTATDHKTSGTTRDVTPSITRDPVSGLQLRDDAAGIPLNWPRIRRICRIVRDAPGGGIDRAELARRLGSDPGRDLMIAYARGLIDFAGPYVVRSLPRRRGGAS